MADVAAMAGVSQQTVSRVVNGRAEVSDSTRERVQEAMEKLGFRPNYAGRSLRGGRYRAIGLCMNDITMAGNSTTVTGLLSAARENGYAVSMIEPDPYVPLSLTDAARRLSELPVDGIIINMNTSVIAEDFESFVPFPNLETVIMSMYAHPKCSTVDSDHYDCGVQICEYLMAHGHREIRFISGPEHSIPSEFRESAWREELSRAGLPVVEPYRGDWSANSGYEIGLKLAQDKEMTAIFAGNDQMALGAMLALHDCGIEVPEDVSVVGVDDSLEGIVPHNMLTTIKFDLFERGRRVFDCAVGTLGSQGNPVAIRLPGTLIERASVRDLR